MSNIKKEIVFPEWKKEWEGMPEYQQEKIMPYKEVIVRFKTKEDMDLFYDTICQKAPNKLKSIWFPKTKKKEPMKDVYTDES